MIRSDLLKRTVFGAAAILLSASVPVSVQAESVGSIITASLPDRPTASSSLAEKLARLAPAANPQVIRLALDAISCAGASGMGKAERLAVIDYSRPSSEPRMWVFDLAKGRLMFEELVAHGKNTGDNHARNFSNKMNSLATSIGLFRTAETYHGSNGYSLRMDGLDRGFNDKAKERAIVIHGAPYVSNDFAAAHGRIGRSWGCPAVRSAVAKKLIDIMKDGQFVFSYYPDSNWLKSSPFLNCKASHMASNAAAKGDTAADS